MRKYRRRRRMKRPGKNKTAKTVAAVVLCLVAAIVLTVIFGNYLKDKAASTRPSDQDTTDSSETAAAPDDNKNPFGANTVEAGYLDLSADAVGEKSAAEVADVFFATSYTAASFELRDDGGSLLYTSEVASALGQKSASSLDIKSLVSILSERDVYTVGCFESTAYTDGVKDQMYDVIVSYESALVRELFEMGVDEILLTSVPVSTGSVDGALEYVKAIKSSLPEGSRVGISLPYTLLFDEGVAQVTKELSLAADFMAVDMSGFEYVDVYEDTNKFIRDNELYISRYGMRILLSHSDAATLSSQINALSANAVYNWQIIN